jgi:hypothetical protein
MVRNSSIIIAALAACTEDVERLVVHRACWRFETVR